MASIRLGRQHLSVIPLFSQLPPTPSTPSLGGREGGDGARPTFLERRTQVSFIPQDFSYTCLASRKKLGWTIPGACKNWTKTLARIGPKPSILSAANVPLQHFGLWAHVLCIREGSGHLRPPAFSFGPNVCIEACRWSVCFYFHT